MCYVTRCYCTYVVKGLHDFVVISVKLRAVDVFRHFAHPLRVPIGKVPLVGERYHTLDSKE